MLSQIMSWVPTIQSPIHSEWIRARSRLIVGLEFKGMRQSSEKYVSWIARKNWSTRFGKFWSHLSSKIIHIFSIFSSDCFLRFWGVCTKFKKKIKITFIVLKISYYEFFSRADTSFILFGTSIKVILKKFQKSHR